MRFLNLLLLFFTVSVCYGQLSSPIQFLSTKYGEEFTPHHELVHYVQHVSSQSSRVKLEQYGVTNEDRPMYLIYISTPENIAALETIRLTNLSNIGLAQAPAQKLEKSIVWLSFSVHGNEAGGSESSMSVLYDLANPQNKETEAYLKNTVVIIDPSLNPDGYSRYTHWVRGISGKLTHPGLTDREHMEPWPGGRVNHYLFDLNRDWAWQTQLESRNRMVKYNMWMPHVHADLHEMGYQSHYYFAPAAEPYHEFISDFQRRFQVEIGKNNAKYFDENGWLYFTREVFDLFYPSYGDTYPTFNGAVGMTYEKAGHGMAGRAIALDNGDTLTLADRIIQHKTTALATVEIASKNQSELISQFKNYFSSSRAKPLGKYHTYIVKAGPNSQRLQDLLTRNGIQYGFAESSSSGSGYDYFEDKINNYNVQRGDLIIHADQPRSVLCQVLFEPTSTLKDSLTYDITAWSLPFAYGLRTYGSTKKLSINTVQKIEESKVQALKEGFAYVIPWKNLASVEVLAKLHRAGIKVRMAKKNIAFDAMTITKGSLVITKGDNGQHPNLLDAINSLVSGHEVRTLPSGFSTAGGDLGGSSFQLLIKPKALLLSGHTTSNNEVGQVWHYFDEVIGYELSVVDIQNWDKIDLREFNTIILPDGWYKLDDDQMKSLSDWVEKGGKIIAIDGALRSFNEKEGWALSKYATEDEKAAADKDAEAKALSSRLDSYEDAERRSISGSIPGAIFENKIDTTHPICFGLGEKYYSLKTGTQHYKHLKNIWNPVYLADQYKTIGFVGAKVKDQFKETATIAVEDKGSGRVIYMVDNPLFRGFWENGLMLFSNALFLVTSDSDPGI